MFCCDSFHEVVSDPGRPAARRPPPAATSCSVRFAEQASAVLPDTRYSTKNHGPLEYTNCLDIGCQRNERRRIMTDRAEVRTPDTGHDVRAGMRMSALAAASALGLSERTIRRAIAYGLLDAVKQDGVPSINPIA